MLVDVQECDASKADTSTNAGYKKESINFLSIL